MTPTDTPIIVAVKAAQKGIRMGVPPNQWKYKSVNG